MNHIVAGQSLFYKEFSETKCAAYRMLTWSRPIHELGSRFVRVLELEFAIYINRSVVHSIKYSGRDAEYPILWKTESYKLNFMMVHDDSIFAELRKLSAEFVSTTDPVDFAARMPTCGSRIRDAVERHRTSTSKARKPSISLLSVVKLLKEISQ